MSGNITREYTVWCGRCPKWTQDATSNTKALAVKEFRRNGWKESKNGWVCPDCMREEEQS